MYPHALLKLIEDFERLPGIGEKTAERLALFLATQIDQEDLVGFSKHILDIKDQIKPCQTCHMLTDQDICAICQSTHRDRETLMVVGDPKDVFILEKMRSYQGLYHVLGGLIDFSRGITDEALSIDALMKRLPHTKELIIATNQTVEGETTAKYLKSLLKDQPIKLTRLASGLPVGGDLKYADELTLAQAVEHRKDY
ncbi:MAG: recombination mediator RecR [Acholeplasmataceae bacterium]